MKKSILSINIIIIIALAVSGCKGKEKSNFSVAHSGIINFVQGDCVIISGSGEKKGMPGDMVTEGMKIVTKGKKSVVDIYIDSNAVRISGDSELEFSRLFKSEDGSLEQVEMNLVSGSVFSRIVKKLSKQDEYSIKTPTAVASVRGTEFMVETNSNMTNVSCLEGKVAVLDVQNENEIVISENEQVQAESGKDMVKSQIDTDKMKILDIISNIEDIQSDISRKYDEQKKEIMEKVDRQIEQDREIVDDQKRKDAENIKNIVEDTEKKTDEITQSVDKNIEESGQKIKKQMDDVQPDLDKSAPDIDPNSF